MRQRSRRGAIVVLAAILLVVMVGMIAFAVDIGAITVARTELQTAADAAALAGVAKLPAGQSAAEEIATEYVGHNLNANDLSKLSTSPGQWNRTSRKFQPGLAPYDAFQVQVDSADSPLFFGRIFGTATYNATASATAVVRPRDIMLVLDFSGSMNDESKITHLKEAVAVFFDVLDDTSAGDRVGLVHYSTDAVLRSTLSDNFGRLDRQVQSARAEGWTNIGGGMEIGRQQLENGARSHATRMIVLMTDGMANRPEDRDPRGYVIDEANLAKTSNIDVFTISFGSDADGSLMQQVADITKDVHFHVQGTRSHQRAELREVFRTIAEKRKISLVN